MSTFLGFKLKATFLSSLSSCFNFRSFHKPFSICFHWSTLLSFFLLPSLASFVSLFSFVRIPYFFSFLPFFHHFKLIISISFRTIMPFKVINSSFNKVISFWFLHFSNTFTGRCLFSCLYILFFRSLKDGQFLSSQTSFFSFFLKKNIKNKK